jgi:hypothetical protein
MGIDAVYTEGNAIAPPQELAGADSSGEAQKTVKADTKGSDPYTPEIRKVLTCIVVLQDIFKEIAETKPVRRMKFDYIINLILNFSIANPSDAVSFVLGEPPCKNTPEKNAVDSCILAALIAREMSLDKQKIFDVAAGALFHDIGMLRLPKETVDKKGQLTEAEFQLIQAHTLYSYHLLKLDFKFSDAVAIEALSHHEHWDGTGYPNNLSGRNIVVGARIISIVDSFLAMVIDKPYRNSMLANEAMKTLVSENARHFSPDVLQAFVKVMGVYPISSRVLLNDGRIAKVISLTKDVPLRPTVQIVQIETGEPGEIINLFTDKNFYIVKATGK